MFPLKYFLRVPPIRSGIHKFAKLSTWKEFLDISNLKFVEDGGVRSGDWEHGMSLVSSPGLGLMTEIIDLVR